MSICVVISCSGSGKKSDGSPASTDSGDRGDSTTSPGSDSVSDLATASDSSGDTADLIPATDSESGLDSATGTMPDSATATGSDSAMNPDTGADTDSRGDTSTDTGTGTAADSDSATDSKGPDATGCIRIDRVNGVEYAPAAVRVTFRVLDCEGYPLRKLTEADVAVLNDSTGQDFNLSSEGGGASAPDLPSEFGFYTVLALDMSDSIFNNDAVDDVIAGAKIFVEQMVTNAPLNQKQKVAILVFGRTNAISIVQDFTSDDGLLNTTLDSLAARGSLGTTNLYGAYLEALTAVTARGTSLDLVERSVVILTDGTHEAGDDARLRNEALTARRVAEQNSNTTVFSIGIHGDYDEIKLSELATREDYFIMAENAAALEQTFSEVASRVERIAHSNYVVGVCTPVELGNPSLTVKVSVADASDSAKVFYSTAELTGNLSHCAPQTVASPCMDFQCGTGALPGFSCGVCTGTTEWCNDGVCVEGCSDWQCGTSPVGNVDCGSCSKATEWCNDGVCVEGCSDWQCGTSPVGNVNCGTCSGTAEWCDAGSCVDDCAGLTCGYSPNENKLCGTCDGATEWCNAGRCMDDCAGLRCGYSPNENFLCGTCSGATEWCNAGVCEDGCVSLECGISPDGNVDCGACPETNEWCNAGTCEEISALGTWVDIRGGTFSMGSDTGETDETPVHMVTVGDFKMLKTEVTAGQYKACVDAGVCGAAGSGNVATYDEPGYENHPINYVTWEDAVTYCQWVGGRLPSEAEWEYAARSEGQDIRYPWGGSINCTYAVYAGCSEGRTAEVCSVPAGNTDQGLCDMAGNVTELVQDNYHATYTGAPTDGSAWFDGSGVQVLRSGNFSQTVLYARTTDRWSVHYQLPQYGIGFRCAR